MIFSEQVLDQDSEQGSEQQTVDVQKGAAVEIASPQDAQQEQQWFLSEGVKGDGDIPEWFNRDTFSSVSEQAKAYTESRKKITELTDRFQSIERDPDTGETIVPEEYSDKHWEDSGVELFSQESDPVGYELAKGFKDTARDLKLPQSHYEKLTKPFIDYIQKSHDAEKARVGEEIEKLGPTAKQDLSQILQWAQQVSPDTPKESIAQMLVSADAVRLFQKLRDTSSFSFPSAQSEVHINPEYLQGRISDERYGRDKEFTKKVDDEYRSFYDKRKI